MNVAASISNKEEWIYLIKLCQRAGRYSDMCEYFSRYLDRGLEISSAERHLFSVAHHGRVTQMRTAYRIASNILSGQHEDASVGTATLKTLEEDIRNLCERVLVEISSKIRPTCVSPDQRAYFLKLRGDFERYLAEVIKGPARALHSKNASELYVEASDISLCHLSPMDPVRLSLMLNFSIFYYEIYNEPERACIVAKAACDDAIDAGILSKKHSGADSEERLTIFNLIRSNLIKWTTNLTSTVHG